MTDRIGGLAFVIVPVLEVAMDASADVGAGVGAGVSVAAGAGVGAVVSLELAWLGVLAWPDGNVLLLLKC